LALPGEKMCLSIETVIVMRRHPLKLDTVREDRAIENLTSRLTESFADIHTPEDIESAIRTARESFAGDPVRDYVPILYEAQFVDAAAQRKLKPGMVLMYPSPTVQSKHTLIALNANGQKLGELLSTDTELQRLAARHGFRTADQAQFANVVNQYDVPVVKDVIDVADTPTYDALERMLDAVSKSYR